MPRKPSDARSEMSQGTLENTFYDDEGTILVNKLGVRDKAELGAAEERGLALATATLFLKAKPDQALTPEFIQNAHREIFGHIYEWAGKWRAVSISKGYMRWPPAMFLAQSMETLGHDVLSQYAPSKLREDRDFVKAVAVIQGEFLAVHPFREGNARTIKLCTDVLAVQSGRPQLAYDSTPEGRNRYIDANKAAVYNLDYSFLEREIREALERSQALHMERTDSRERERDR